MRNATYIHIFLTVQQSGPMTIEEIAAETLMHRSNVCHYVNRLRQYGLLDRRYRPNTGGTKNPLEYYAVQGASLEKLKRYLPSQSVEQPTAPPQFIINDATKISVLESLVSSMVGGRRATILEIIKDYRGKI